MLKTFIICSESDNPSLEKKIKEKFSRGNNMYVVREDSQWLVRADLTTKQMYERIEIDNRRVIVFLATNYWGLHKKDMWEWLELDANGS